VSNMKQRADANAGHAPAPASSPPGSPSQHQRRGRTSSFCMPSQRRSPSPCVPAAACGTTRSRWAAAPESCVRARQRRAQSAGSSSNCSSFSAAHKHTRQRVLQVARGHACPRPLARGCHSAGASRPARRAVQCLHTHRVVSGAHLRLACQRLTRVLHQLLQLSHRALGLVAFHSAAQLCEV